MEEQQQAGTANLLARLETTDLGLSSTEAQRRLATYGPNRIDSFKKGSLESALEERLRPKCRALRDGNVQQICTYDLVPGDVIELRGHEFFPADVVLLSLSSKNEPFVVDQSNFTGEMRVTKTEGSQCFMGTQVQFGPTCARAVVIATSAETVYAKRKKEKLENQPSKPSSMLSKECIAELIKNGIVPAAPYTPIPSIDVLMLGVGDLTQTQRAVHSVWAGGDAWIPVAEFDKNDQALCGVLQGAAFASALINSPLIDKVVVNSAGVLLGENSFMQQVDVTRMEPFFPETKRCTVTTEPKSFADKDRPATKFTKGAVQVVTKVCQSTFFHGKAEPLDKKKRARIRMMTKIATKEGLRCLAVAKCDSPSKDVIQHNDQSGWTFLGLVAFTNPPRQDAAAEVANLIASGMKVVIATGENRAFTKHLASEVLEWHLVPLQVQMEGGAVTSQTRAAILSPNDLVQALDWTTIMKEHQAMILPECDPKHKFQLVEQLQKHGFMVSCVGKEMEDAAVVRQGIGIAVKDSSSAVSAAASFLVTNDNALSSISHLLGIVISSNK